jgi:hypothetical protein
VERHLTAPRLELWVLARASIAIDGGSPARTKNVELRHMPCRWVLIPNGSFYYVARGRRVTW